MRAILLALALLVAAAGGYAFKEFAVARDASVPPQAVIDHAISQYLKDHPDEVMDAIKLAQANAQHRQEADARLALEQKQDQIYNNPADPVVGNAQGDVTVVEFFDYRCPYCKQLQLEEPTSKKPMWIIIAAILCILGFAGWLLVGVFDILSWFHR